MRRTNIVKSTDTYLSLGTNLGNRRAYLSRAIGLLRKMGHLFICSSVYETSPWGRVDQPYFLNQVVGLSVLRPAQVLSQHLRRAEQQLGRSRRQHWGPREIDIDLLYYGNTILNTPTLTLPHPQLHKRLFVLRPMVEVAPTWVHPVFDKTQSELMAMCKDKGVVKKVDE